MFIVNSYVLHINSKYLDYLYFDVKYHFYTFISIKEIFHTSQYDTFFLQKKTNGIKRHENTKSIIAIPYTLPVHSVA